MVRGSLLWLFVCIICVTVRFSTFFSYDIKARPTLKPFLGLEELVTPESKVGNTVKRSFEKYYDAQHFVRLNCKGNLH